VNSSDVWHTSDPDAYPNDPNGSLVPILEASVEAAKQRHPSASGDTPGVVLTGADRCDEGCGAGALYRLRLRAMELDFCHHHKAKYFPEMEAWGWVVIGMNPSLHAELFRTDRSQGSDHA
jgi:hypothetical protein